MYACEVYMLADISLRHQCCMERSFVCVFSCLCLDCRGHWRSRPSVTQTICMLLKSVAHTGLGWMLFSVIMSRHGAGRLLPLFGSFVCVCVCVCACQYTLRDACRSTVHSHFLRRLTALRHKASSPPFPVYSVWGFLFSMHLHWVILRLYSGQGLLKIKHPCFSLSWKISPFMTVLFNCMCTWIKIFFFLVLCKLFFSLFFTLGLKR